MLLLLPLPLPLPLPLMLLLRLRRCGLNFAIGRCARVRPAKVVVEAALSKLPLEKRQEFIITDVQRAIDMGLGDVCKDLIRVETVVKRWGLGPAPAL